MKQLNKYIFLGLVLIGFASCEDFLDVNENPNSPTTATAQTVLPQAITAAGSLANSYNIGMGSVSGMEANAGGFSGFGSLITYEYTSSDFTGFWSGAMLNNVDLKYVIDNTIEDPALVFFTSSARILKALNFARMVDQYNDIPYTEALQGKDNTTPAYDNAEDVYKDLVKELTESINDIQGGIDANNVSNGIVQQMSASVDPLFGGNTNKWMRFANTIKLRLLVKMAGVPELAGYANTEFGNIDTSLGFLQDDALVNPGYFKEAGKAAPIFLSRGFAVNGARPTTSRIATKWMLSFYDGGKLNDQYRGTAIYRSFPDTRSNQLGVENDDVPTAPSAGTSWATGANADDSNAIGVTKGFTQGQPIMLAAESYFLQAEAYLKNYLSGDAEAAFENGIDASFNYLYQNASGSLEDGVQLDQFSEPVLDVDGNEIEIDVNGMIDQYYVDNTGDYLVDWSAAAGDEQRFEAIITQKYIALNMVNNDEAFNEYRRTDYPKTVLPTSDPLNTFASTRSNSTRADKLISRILYPNFEFVTNASQVPNQPLSARFNETIFWDLN